MRPSPVDIGLFSHYYDSYSLRSPCLCIANPHCHRPRVTALSYTQELAFHSVPSRSCSDNHCPDADTLMSHRAVCLAVSIRARLLLPATPRCRLLSLPPISLSPYRGSVDADARRPLELTKVPVALLQGTHARAAGLRTFLALRAGLRVTRLRSCVTTWPREACSPRLPLTGV